MSMPVTSSNPTRDLFFLPIFSHSFQDEKGEHYFIVHFDEFYTALFSHNTDMHIELLLDTTFSGIQ